MITTYSKFYYGLEVTSETKYIDFDEGSGELTTEVQAGFYTLEELADAVEDALNEIGSDTYTVTVNRTTRVFTIASTGTFDLLWDTGTNTAETIGEVLGFSVAADDTGGSSYVADGAAGSVYIPQFKLQDYVSESDFRMLRNATKHKSASGLVEVINFGTDRFFEFSIKFATDIPQPSSGPIISNSSGVANLQSFMQWITKGGQIEFMPDSATPSTYYKLILDSGSGDSNGLGYKLLEQYGRGLVGYYESGVLKFRILGD